MSMSGWWFIDSAASATCCTSSMPDRNDDASTSRVIELPSSPAICQDDRSPESAWSISSRGSNAISDLLARVPTSDLGAQERHRIVLAVDYALLHRDDRVVGDVDVLRAHLGAALGDVAHAE